MRRAKRVIAAGLAGAVAMFIWGALSHLALLKGAGFTRLPNEEIVVAALRTSISEDGLYFFPSPDFSGKTTAAETAAWEAQFRAGPTGMIVYHRSGGSPVSPKKLLLQFLSELFAAGIGGFVLSLIVAPYWKRVLVMGLLGAFSCLSVSAIYWNWYGFPHAFFLAQCVDKVLGWLLAGSVMAAIVPEARTRQAAALRAQ